MINILLPALGSSTFFQDSFFPKTLYEISGKTMLERVIDNFSELPSKEYIFVFSDEDCNRFHVDAAAKILTDGCKVIKLRNQTAGALCTCLMTLEYIDNETPLIIANCDQIIQVDYNRVLSKFDEQNNDAGLILFPNIHPRWSYAKIKGDEVMEVAEKRPLSKSAIAGFYYFRQGHFFVEAAKRAIMKDNSLDDIFYISASINELILMGKKIGYYDIKKEQYCSFYSPEKIKEYEAENG